MRPILSIALITAFVTAAGNAGAEEVEFPYRATSSYSELREMRAPASGRLSAPIAVGQTFWPGLDYDGVSITWTGRDDQIEKAFDDARSALEEAREELKRQLDLISAQNTAEFELRNLQLSVLANRKAAAEDEERHADDINSLHLASAARSRGRAIEEQKALVIRASSSRTLELSHATAKLTEALQTLTTNVATFDLNSEKAEALSADDLDFPLYWEVIESSSAGYGTSVNQGDLIAVLAPAGHRRIWVEIPAADPVVRLLRHYDTVTVHLKHVTPVLPTKMVLMTASGTPAFGPHWPEPKIVRPEWLFGRIVRRTLDDSGEHVVLGIDVRPRRDEYGWYWELAETPPDDAIARMGSQLFQDGGQWYLRNDVEPIPPEFLWRVSVLPAQRVSLTWDQDDLRSDHESARRQLERWQPTQ